MIDEGFFFLDNGSIGEIIGFNKLQFSSYEEEHILNNNTRERLNTFNPPAGLSISEYSGMFLDAFLTARKETREQDKPTTPFIVTVQIGNSESVKELDIIENNKMFSHWENPQFVSQFRECSKKYLSE